MSHDKLWAPWRLAYIKGETDAPAPRPTAWLDGADETCFLCRVVAEHRHDPSAEVARANLTVGHGPDSVVVLNRFPYNNGHLLVCPRRHVGRLDELTAAEQLELQQWLTRLTAALEKLVNAHGFNIGLNLGQAAGAGVPGHLHWHLVPRWPGDVNFMPVTGEVDLISQSLDALWTMLHDERLEL